MLHDIELIEKNQYEYSLTNKHELDVDEVEKLFNSQKTAVCQARPHTINRIDGDQKKQKRDYSQETEYDDQTAR